MNDKEIAERNSNLQWRGILKVILQIAFPLIFLLTFGFINKSNSWNNIMIQISLGFLTFVSIFYSLVLRRDIKEQRERILISEWKGDIRGFSKAVDLLKKEANKDYPNYNEMLRNSEIISEKLESMTAFEKELNINSQLSWSIRFFIAAVIILLVDSIWGLPIKMLLEGGFNIRVAGYGCVWIGFYKAIELVLSWDRLINFRQFVR